MAGLTTTDSKKIRRRAALLVQRRNAMSGLAHLKAEEIKRLSVLKNGARLTSPGNEAWADELAAALHPEMPWMGPATEAAWHALRRSAHRGDVSLRLQDLCTFAWAESARRGLSDASAEAIVMALAHPVSRTKYISLRGVIRMIETAEVLERRPRLQ